jgi:hypothetical protein
MRDSKFLFNCSTYPSQSNKATKMTPRIPPKNGSAFQPGQIIRLEFPAQGYVSNNLIRRSTL